MNEKLFFNDAVHGDEPALEIRFLMTPRRLTSPEKIDALLEKRMRKFLARRRRTKRLGKGK